MKGIVVFEARVMDKVRVRVRVRIKISVILFLLGLSGLKASFFYN